MAVMYEENYLGSIWIQRVADGDGPPSLPVVHVLRLENGRLRYATGAEGHQLNLNPTDRRLSTAVMDDAPEEVLTALEEALRADRWQNVVRRG